MEDQGPFDLLIHKITYLFSAARGGDESSQNAINNFEEYTEKHRECVLLDPLDNIRRILNRYSQYQWVTECQALKDHRYMVPAFVLLDSNSVLDNRDKLAQAGVTFPLMCKPLLADGPAPDCARRMSIIFSEESLQDLEIPCVALSFINHDAILYKIMVIGCKQFIVKRPSIRNFYPGKYPTIFFDTLLVSKADSDHALTAVDPSSTEDPVMKPDWTYLDSLGQAMRTAMGLDLFGFDVIIDSLTGQYCIIDVNFFPTYEAIGNFFDLLFEHVVNVLYANDRGELVNGRLLATPNVPATVDILDQLNLAARRSQEKLDVYKAWPSTPVSPLASLCTEGNNNNGIYLQEDKDSGKCEATWGKHNKTTNSISSIDQKSTRWGLGQPPYIPDQPGS